MAKKHIHKYHRITLKFGQVWACALPDCSHHMPENLTPTLLGKSSLCWKCDEKFILDDTNMLLNQPVCINCNETTPELSSFLEKFGVK